MLKRQGLGAWIEAFSGCVGAVAPEPSPHRFPAPPTLGASRSWEASGAVERGVPVRLYPELIRLVAGLALGRLKEGR